MAVIVRRKPQPNLIEAACLASDEVGDVVCITGPAQSHTYQVTKVDIDDPYKICGVGVITEKTSDTSCYIQCAGELKNIYTGLLPGRPVFVQTTGRLSTSPPARPSMGSSAQRASLTNSLVVLPIDRPSVGSI
jgi:hypothetical protein